MSFLTSVQNKISGAAESFLETCNLATATEAPTQIDIPKDFQCPISHDTMKDPVEVIHKQTLTEFIKNIWRLIPLINQLGQPLPRHLFNREDIEAYAQQEIGEGRALLCPLCRREISTTFDPAEDIKIAVDDFFKEHPSLRDLSNVTTVNDFDAIIQARGLQRSITKKTTQTQQGNTSISKHLYTGSGINQLVRQEELPQPTNPLPFFRNIQQFRFYIEEGVNQEDGTTSLLRKITERHIVPINPMLIEREFRRILRNEYNYNSSYLFYYIASVLIPTLIVWKSEPNFSNAFSNIISDSPPAIGITFLALLALNKLYPTSDGQSIPRSCLLSLFVFNGLIMLPLLRTVTVIGSYVRLLGFTLGLQADVAIAIARREPIQPRVLN